MKRQLNPLVARELRGGLRSGRRITLLTFTLSIVGLLFLGVYALTAVALSAGGQNAESAAVGSIFFPIVVGVELFFVCVITPAQTAGAIVNERERQTFDMLLVTPLTHWQIAFGKLVASLAYSLLLLVAALPIESLAFLMGGVGPAELAIGIVLLLCTMLFFGCLGLWSSVSLAGTRGATALAYALTGLLTLGLPVLALFATPLTVALVSSISSISQVPPWLIYLGELVAATNPWITAGLTEAQLRSGLPIFWMHQLIAKTNVDVPGPWLVFSALYLVGSFLLLAATARSIKQCRS